jgi:CPA2 family monovalent cation:H+ antiporter-2
LLGGFIQVAGTILLATLVSIIFGIALQSAIFYGFIIACSSTAIVIKLLQDRIEINTEYGKLVLAILLFQDVIIVPLMLFLPLLSGQEANWAPAMLILLAKMAGLVLGPL